ncbi:hypothetical protein E2562_026463 [Oryza meyeriana var. granulata]|uniref:Secreted protein n=1 Tax=Oryza meyeriana var. granulata TaxID=110450 RepID=A0A6G1DQU8_9ORYZ|nr:hypothetical protein E2562_026463 [Oryza meyeriana var. granulata]
MAVLSLASAVAAVVATIAKLDRCCRHRCRALLPLPARSTTAAAELYFYRCRLHRIQPPPPLSSTTAAAELHFYWRHLLRTRPPPLTTTTPTLPLELSRNRLGAVRAAASLRHQSGIHAGRAYVAKPP